MSIEDLKPEGYKKIRDFILVKMHEGKGVKQGYLTLVEAARRKFITEGATCLRCGSNQDLTIDHIVPVSLLEAFQLPVNLLLDDDNFQVLCRRCNWFKSNKMDFSNPRTKELLIKYVNLIQ